MSEGLLNKVYKNIRLIVPYTENREIFAALKVGEFVCFLIRADWLNSVYCYKNLMKNVLKKFLWYSSLRFELNLHETIIRFTVLCT
jgi:hypothetical protein